MLIIDDEMFEGGGIFIHYNIIDNNDLSVSEKIVLAVIQTHTGVKGLCELTNDQLADMLNMNRSTIIRSIRKLEELGLIERLIINHRFRELRYIK